MSSAEFVRNFGRWQDRASIAPVYITHHGRARQVLVTMQAYERLTADDAAAEPAGAADGVQLETLVHQLDAIFIAIDTQRVVTHFNPAASAYFKHATGEIVAQPLDQRLAELDRSVVRVHLERALESGDVATLDMPATSRAAEWLRCSIFPFADGAACLIRVVTAERSIRVSERAEQSLTAALDATQIVGRARLSLRGTFLDVDRRYAEMAGFAPEELNGARLGDILPLSLRVAAQAEIEGVLTDGEPRAFDTRLMVRRGADVPVRIALSPLFGDYAIEGALVVMLRLDD